MSAAAGNGQTSDGGGEATPRNRWARKPIHREVEGTRAATGPIIQITGRNDWEADTACGERVPTIHVTRKESAVTCTACLPFDAGSEGTGR